MCKSSTVGSTNSKTRCGDAETADLCRSDGGRAVFDSTEGSHVTLLPDARSGWLVDNTWAG